MTFKSKLKTRKSPTTQRNFGLTEEDFCEMVSLMKDGNEKLFEKIFLSHFSECMNFLKTNYKINHSEAYDISMDTLLSFRKGLMKDKFRYGNLRFLFTRIATQKLIKEKRKTSKLAFIDELLEMEEKISVSNEEELKFLEQAWSKLDQKSQSILKLFYFDKMKLSEIADAQSKSHCAIRKQKERSIIALRKNYLKISSPTTNRF